MKALKMLGCPVVLCLCLSAGCQQAPSTAPPAATALVSTTAPLDVHTAPQKVHRGMTEAEVRAALGSPFDGGRATSSDTSQPSTGFLRFRNPEQGFDVAEVLLVNDRVTAVEVKTYPRWVIEWGLAAGKSRQQMKEDWGTPSRIGYDVIRGKKMTYWVYTDRVASKRTLRIDFGSDSRVTAVMFGPNRDDWDKGIGG